VKLRYQSRACEEFHQAVVGYQDVNPEAARKFVSEVERGLRRMQQFPEICRRWLGDYRMMRPPSFPYGWFYCVEPDESSSTPFCTSTVTRRQSPPGCMNADRP